MENSHERQSLLGLYDTLTQFSEGVSEFELMQVLDAQGFFGKLPEDVTLALFHKHFWLMHALYRLQEDLCAERAAVLTINPLSIHLDKWREVDAEAPTLDVEAPELRAYYLDLNNLSKASSASVADLIGSFWQRYAKACVVADEDGVNALATFDLDTDATLGDLRAAYRRRAQSVHPDRGGSKDEFVVLKHAYDTAYAFLRSGGST